MKHEVISFGPLAVEPTLEGNDIYQVRYWELVIPAKLSENIAQKPLPGSDVHFSWNHKSDAMITKVIKNLLED